MAIVCFDTHVVIWGIQKVASPEQENMLFKAEALIAACDEKKHQIIIPSLVFGEVLMGIPPDEHPVFISLMHQKLRIVPFDAKAASLFAKMWCKWSETKNYPDSLDGKRPGSMSPYSENNLFRYVVLCTSTCGTFSAFHWAPEI